MNIIFAGTPEFAATPLLALLEHHTVSAVYTQPDRKAGRGKRMTAPPVKQVALEHGIPVHQPTTLKTEVDTISALAPDVMVVVAYGMLLPQSILDIPKFGCINIHASLLPKWRGAAPIQRAIEAGDTMTGVSIMQMERGLDTGPVYTTLETPISDRDTSASLHDRLAQLGAAGIVDTLAMLATDPSLQPTPQDHSQSSYARKIEKSEAEIDWQSSAAEIDRKLRAFTPWPGSQTQHGSNRIRITEMRVAQTNSTAQPGTVIALSTDCVTVACGSGAVELLTLQRDGSRALPYREFRNGYSLSIGDRLS
ncbi:methionyl-tRNA formyltransferase [Arenicella chitinivorans]|uniref:Methionyl-tRNA formyltransferase n=1 Tax=Arenicella chitinivorans TaxID=1329800 RepID=A0A918S240_9GAMM|nr:methionyl-tRNA formyltransferase [Arenicella chitinivorans]GHA20061.1 methionyl-tRNA formyltransferase [Arenicella chitinivorans]